MVEPHLFRRRVLGVALGLGVLATVVLSRPPPRTTHTTGDVRTAEFYEQFINNFTGGYTVAGSSFTQGGAAGSSITEFAVAQECLCEVVATAHGVFARGANADNAFSLIAALEAADGRWHAQQVSVGTKPAYQATMRFGSVPGGAHSAVGFFLNPEPGGEQTTFRADQSAVGCHNGVGYAACEHVCGEHGLSWEQIRAKCGQSLPALGGSVLTDWQQHHPDGTRRTSAARFVESGPDQLWLVGSDDGVHFWTLRGAWTGDAGGASASLVVDFRPKGGPPDLPGVWSGDRISWRDGNVWSSDAPPCAVRALAERVADPDCWRGPRER